MDREDLYVIRKRNQDVTETETDYDDDEGVANGMIDDDDVFELVSAQIRLAGRPESSWEAIIDNLSQVRLGNA